MAPKNFTSPGAMPEPPVVCAKIGQAARRNSTTISSIILFRIFVYLPFRVLKLRRGGGSNPNRGERRLTLERDYAGLMFVRSSNAHINHREQGENVGLQK